LAEGGRLVIPVGSRAQQTLEIWERKTEKVSKANSISVVFVPLLGDEGWPE
jgi:protein-L-isoaspartate O-methyltransferase